MDVHNKKEFRFFRSDEERKNSDKNSASVVHPYSERDVDHVFRKEFEINTLEELYALVTKAIAAKYANQANKELSQTLDNQEK